MRVTDKNYYMDNLLLTKLDLMIDRCSGKKKMDNLIIIDGDEGFGKSNLSTAVAYYVAHKTGRKFTEDNMYFDADKLREVAQSTSDQVLVWDESALSALSTEWYKKEQQNLIKLLMVARKKRHFYIFCIPKFFKLNEYLIVDRSIALLHVYARGGTQLGRFAYFSKKNKEKLYYTYKNKKIRAYGKLANFRGSFSAVLPLIIDEGKYEKKKDDAILTIGKPKKKEVNKEKLVLCQLQSKLSKIYRRLGVKQKDVAKELDVSERTLQKWGKLVIMNKNLLENGVKEPNPKQLT